MADAPVREGLTAFARRWMVGLGEWLGHRAIPPMAAALAYRTVFSIIPICIIALVVLQRFVNKQTVVDDIFARIMAWLGVSQISVSTDEAMKIDSVLRQLATSFDRLSFTGIGIVSGLTLVYAAISLLIELENGFNKLYNAPRGRSLVRRIMQYWLLVSLGPVLLAGSFMVAERVTGSLGITGAEEAGWLLRTFGFLSSVAISTLALWVLYITVPNTKVKPMAALNGAVVGAVALEAAKYGFHLYLERAALKSLYGSLALIPIFLLWVYTTWLVVLTGLRVSYLVQHGRRVSILHLAAGLRSGGAFVDPAYSVAVACEVARAFERGDPSSVEQVAERAAMTDQAARVLLERLTEDHILLEVGGDNVASGRERYVLARPAETIEVETLLQSGFAAVGGRVPGPVAAMRAAQLVAARGRTLADEVAASRPVVREVVQAVAAKTEEDEASVLAGEPVPVKPIPKEERTDQVKEAGVEGAGGVGGGAGVGAGV